MFTIHSAGVVFGIFFLWGNVMVAFGFVISTFFSSVRTATAASFLILIISGEVALNLILPIIQDPDATESSYAALMLWPPFAMARGVLWIAIAGAGNNPITAANWSTFADGNITKTFAWLIAHWCFWMFALWYLDKVWVSGFGVAKHPLFCLGFGDSGDGGSEVAQSSKPDFSGTPDVNEEYDRVHSGDNSELAIRTDNIGKQFKLPTGDTKTAVKHISIGVDKKQCFGLLGHNGAGKTTTINMLTGLFPPSVGFAQIESGGREG